MAEPSMVGGPRSGQWIAHLLLLLGVLVVAFPIYYVFVASTHPLQAILRPPLPLLPGPDGPANYAEALTGGVRQIGGVGVDRILLNTTVMALAIAVGKIVISIASAYAIVFFRFPLRMVFFWMIFITLMLPVEVRMLPTYKVMVDLNLIDTYAGLILPLIASATATLLFRQFFMTIPNELLEAARVDGAGPWRFFKDILLPLSATNIAALFVILFIYGWTQYLWPLLVTNSNEMNTIVIALRRMISFADADTPWHLVMVTCVLAIAAADPRRRPDAALVREGPRGDREVMATVSLADVRKSYGPTEVIHGVSIDVADGEFIVIVGPSGCGKSTLLRMVAGLEAITSGTIAIAGRVVNGLEPRARDIAMVFQNYALYPHMSVFDNMAYGLRIAGIRGADLKARVEATAAMLELTPYLGRRPRELSGGQRQRVAMGRALVRGPAAFLLDEPLSNLDAKLRVQMRLQIKALQREVATTALYVTHDQVEAMTLADRLIVMNAGVAEQIDTPLAVYERPATVFVAGFIGSPAMNIVKGTVRSGMATLPTGTPVAPAPGAEGTPLLVGIRPEHLAPCPPDAPGTIPVDIEAAELLGADAYGHGHLPGDADPFVVRFPGSAPPRPGDRLTARADPAFVHLFDPATGRRLEPSP